MPHRTNDYPTKPNRRADAEDMPVTWFVTLQIAYERNDFALAAQSQRELRRLGIEVKYLPKPAVNREVAIA